MRLKIGIILKCILLVAIVLLFNLSSVKAECIDVVDIKVKEKNDKINVVDPKIENNEIESEITFNEINDYVTFELTLKNIKDEKYKLSSIKDNNTTESIEIEYKYDNDDFILNEETAKVELTLRYVKEPENGETININNLTIDIELEEEDGTKQIVNINNPETKDNIILYIGIFATSLIISIVVLKKSKKKVFMVIILASILVIPLNVKALEKFAIKIVFKSITINYAGNIADEKIYNTYENVQKLIEDTDIPKNTIVATKGYYSEELGGAAKYNITEEQEGFNEDTDFILNNGLYAKLLIKNNTVTVNQYGAYGDEIHDDTIAIKKAINSGNSIVKFEGNRYKCNSNIVLAVSDVELDGNNSTLFIDDDYYYSENDTYWRNKFYFFSINGNINNGIDINAPKLKNIKIKNLKFENLITKMETKELYYCKVQMRVYNVDDLILDGVELKIPEVVGNKTRNTMNLWLYSGWRNVIIRNCKFINESKASQEATGISIGSRNHDLICENLLFENNYILKKGHDEIIALWDGKIKDVVIKNNEFYEDDSDVTIPSDMIFSFGQGYEDEEIENVQFLNNKIIANSQSEVFYVGAESTNPENCLIKENTIIHTILDNSENLGKTQYPVLITTSYKENSNEIVTLENNNIELTVESPEMEFSFVKNRVNIKDNDIKILGTIKYFIYNTSCFKISNNTIILNDGCDYLIKNAYNFDFNNNNMVIKKGIGDNLISYSTRDFIGNVVIDNNEICIQDENIWENNQKTLFMMYKSDMKNYIVEIKNNTITTNQTNTQLLLNITGMEIDSVDLIKFINNNTDLFSKVNYWGNTSEVHIILE